MVADVSAEALFGGAERMLFHHLRALKEAGMDVTVLTRQPNPDADLNISLEHGFEEHRLPFSGDKGYRGLIQLKQEAKVWWNKHGQDYDVVVSEQPFTMWALMKAGCVLPRLQVCYSFAFEEFETRYGLRLTWKHRLTIAAMRRLERSVYASAQQLMGLSQFTQQRFTTFFNIKAERCQVVAAAADQVAGINDELREQYRQDLNWQTPVVVTLRNLVPRTGVDLMIQVAAIIKNQGLNMRFVIMGDGVLAASMLKMAKDLGVEDCCEFTGFLDEQAVQKRLMAADVFMVPTRGLEGFGLVTLEANACALPVLATPIAANKELVPTIAHNQLATDASPLALAETLTAMLENPLSAEQRKSLQADAKRQYNWAKHDQTFVQMVSALS